MTFEERLAFVNEKFLNVAAVDIGDKGGIVANRGPILICKEMPESTRARMEILQDARPTFIIAENVHTMPFQGVVSNGRLLEQKGELKGIAAAMHVELRWVEPLKWIECFTLKRTKHFNNNKGQKDIRSWKQHLWYIATQMGGENLTLKTADAFLIWNWAVSQETPEPLEAMGMEAIFR